MGFVGLMRDEGLEREMLLDYVTVIERNSVQLMRIIDDILDLSKVEAGMMLIENIEFSLVELLSDFAALMTFRAREKGIEFALQARTELPGLIIADPTRIRQILTNVVGNAIKFTERGRDELFVSFESGQITFEVVDTGRGITDEQRDQLFQPFTQADVSPTRKYGGTGLGLVLTRRLSEALGGRFDLVTSEPGTGSTFVATVQVEVPAEAAMVRALGFEVEVARAAGSAARLKGMDVLLVEDSPDNQALFSIYLGRAGARIEIAGDGARGVEMALAKDYDVVLMDVQMPVMDGIAAVRALRARGFATPIVALTAHAMKEERRRCLDAGYDEFLSKPVSRSELIEALAKYSVAAT
jgi:CheY-like chemotaxis protein